MYYPCIDKKQGGTPAAGTIHTVYLKSAGLAIDNMFAWLCEILLKFRKCFMRETTFQWFVVIVVGLMMRGDTLGITSIIRELHLNPNYYCAILRFFRSTAWTFEKITRRWAQIVNEFGGV